MHQPFCLHVFIWVSLACAKAETLTVWQDVNSSLLQSDLLYTHLSIDIKCTPYFLCCHWILALKVNCEVWICSIWTQKQRHWAGLCMCCWKMSKKQCKGSLYITVIMKGMQTQQKHCLDLKKNPNIILIEGSFFLKRDSADWVNEWHFLSGGSAKLWEECKWSDKHTHTGNTQWGKFQEFHDTHKIQFTEDNKVDYLCLSLAAGMNQRCCSSVAMNFLPCSFKCFTQRNCLFCTFPSENFHERTHSLGIPPSDGYILPAAINTTVSPAS